MRALAAACLAALLIVAPARAGTDPADLARAAAERLNAAHAALQQASRAPDRVKALTRTIRAYEEGLDALREGLRRAALREAEIRREFEAESERLSRLIGVMLSIQSTAGPLVLLHPGGPLGTARSGMIVAEVTPALQRQAEELRARLEEVALLRALQESAAATLQAGLEGVQQARTELSQAISNRTELPMRFVEDPQKLQSLIDSAETLSGFASGLAELPPDAEGSAPIPDFTRARGTLPLPVSGTVLRRFMEPDAAGIARPGLLIATRPLALVTAPWAGTLRYRGPLLDYGNVIILEPQAGVLLVLAGMEQVYGEIGQVVPPGSPLGLMGGAEPDAGTLLLSAKNGTGPELTETLYIELRIGNEPVDPGEWFAETRE